MLEKIKRVVCGIVVLIAVIINTIGCAKAESQAVYIPTKCKTKPIAKPTPSKESNISEDIVEILQYTELLERDLQFCRGE